VIVAPREIRGPDLAGVVADANEAGLEQAIEGSWRGQPFRVASLRTLVGFKRLAGRPVDRVDLEKLERANGELPEDEIPGLER
jgi:hypothetical protein